MPADEHAIGRGRLRHPAESGQHAVLEVRTKRCFVAMAPVGQLSRSVRHGRLSAVLRCLDGSFPQVEAGRTAVNRFRPARTVPSEINKITA